MKKIGIIVMLVLFISVLFTSITKASYGHGHIVKNEIQGKLDDKTINCVGVGEYTCVVYVWVEAQ